MAVQEKFYSADDLLELSQSPEYSEMCLELSEGDLVIMTPAKMQHGVTAMELGWWVQAFVREHRLGYVTAAETGYILFKNPNGRDTVRAPDVGFIAAGRLPEGIPDSYVPFAPDLAIEVVSPNDTADEVQKKVLEYLRYGTRMVWVAYPETRAVMVYTPTSVHLVDEHGTLDGGDVLPGFTLEVSKVFGQGAPE
jgi:Uma2 family endonuclease